MIRVALCGLGYWGKNLFRILTHHDDFRLKVIVDKKLDVIAKARPAPTGLRFHTDLQEILDDVDAVVIATPVASHFELAMTAIQAGKHVLVEKPLCRHAHQAEQLARAAAERGVVLMLDHTFLFHPAVKALQRLIDDDTLGHISYYDSQRVNLGLFQPDVNVLWDLAPHDLSILDHLFAMEPLSIDASGFCHVDPKSPDLAFVTLHYPNNFVAHLNLSWMSPVKVRRIAVGGSKQMVVWDDLNRDEPLKIYDSGITVQPAALRESVLPTYRIGSVQSPRIGGGEPLLEVVDHFRKVILGDVPCRMDGRQGVRIVRTLERIQVVLDQSLSRARAAGDVGFQPDLAVAAAR